MLLYKMKCVCGYRPKALCVSLSDIGTTGCMGLLEFRFKLTKIRSIIVQLQ